MGLGEKVPPHNLYCIQKMFGVTVASDCLHRFNLRHSEASAPLNMQGIVQEREGLFMQAKLSYQRSLALLARDNHSHKDLVIGNLARISCKMELYEEAIGFYKAIKNPDFNNVCGLALAFFKSDKYQQSYQAYQTALSLTDSPGLKSHLLSAMASVAFKVQGVEAAKTLLFQAVQLKPPSIFGILRLSALGIKSGNDALVKAAVNEMKPYEDDPKHMADITTLKAMMLSKNDSKSGIKEIARQIHRFPQVADLWRAMAIHILTQATENRVAKLLSAAAVCAQKYFEAAVRGGLRGSCETLEMTVLALLLASGNEKKCQHMAAKYVHQYPNKTLGWNLLATIQKMTFQDGKPNDGSRMTWLETKCNLLKKD